VWATDRTDPRHGAALGLLAWALLTSAGLGLSACGEEADEAAAPPTVDAGGAPVLVIEEPEPQARVAAEWLRVRGTVAPEVPVTVQGVPAHVAAGRFEATVRLQEGLQTVRACAGADADDTADGGPASACDERTVLLDLHAPQLELVSPARGSAWPDEGPAPWLHVEITADEDADLQGLRVDGVVAAMGPEGGTHQAPLDNSAGLHLLVVEAEDAAGNVTQDHGSYLCGRLEEPGPGTRPQSVLQVGPEALRALEAKVNALALGFDPAPLVGEGLELYASDAVVLHLTGVHWGAHPPVTLSADPKGLRTDVQLAELRAELVLDSPERDTEPTPFEVRVQRLRAEGLVTMGASGGRPSGTLSVTRIAMEGLQVRGLLDPLFEGDSLLIALLEGLAPVVLQALLENLLPVYVEQSLEQLLRPVTVPLPDMDLEIRPWVHDLKADARGLRIWLGLRADLPTGPQVPGREGLALLRHLPPPELPPHPGVSLLLGEDMLNLMLYRVWQAGTLDGVIDQSVLDDAKAEIQLVAGMLGSVADLRGADPEAPLALQLTPSLPPRVELQPERIQLTLGDLLVHASCAEAPNDPLLRLAVSAQVGVAPRGGPRSEEVDPGVEQLDLLLDVLDTDLHDRAERDYEPIVRSQLQGLGPTLATLLNPVRLPLLFGVQLHDLTLQGTQQGGYLLLQARVSGEEP